MSPIDAERAFAADARAIGQWTAFRKWSTDDAVMFVPQPINVHEFLKDRTDPPKAIDWWPTASYVSCDGNLAVNTGGWKRPDGSVGYFSTVWQRQPNGSWKWIVDGGDTINVARARTVTTTRASCIGKPTKIRGDDVPARAHAGSGTSKDGRLFWIWNVDDEGSRNFSVFAWSGRSFRRVINDDIVP